MKIYIALFIILCSSANSMEMEREVIYGEDKETRRITINGVILTPFQQSELKKIRVFGSKAVKLFEDRFFATLNDPSQFNNSRAYISAQEQAFHEYLREKDNAKRKKQKEQEDIREKQESDRKALIEQQKREQKEKKAYAERQKALKAQQDQRIAQKKQEEDRIASKKAEDERKAAFIAQKQHKEEVRQRQNAEKQRIEEEKEQVLIEATLEGRATKEMYIERFEERYQDLLSKMLQETEDEFNQKDAPRINHSFMGGAWNSPQRLSSLKINLERKLNHTREILSHQRPEIFISWYPFAEDIYLELKLQSRADNVELNLREVIRSSAVAQALPITAFHAPTDPNVSLLTAQMLSNQRQLAAQQHRQAVNKMLKPGNPMPGMHAPQSR